ncbi:LysR family transcriptional regulator [Alkalibaculum sp. M08DMB]|uniref:LysR family transcriptional regulator n=1 Tax=Alkalibaculum sporogenes TaxID=2655001 RepID=A0A6A7K5R4_9FIRM|nr:LysR family transcriptional regulator [Alkalibaculum sporogenes]MPW24722.1 LysR family transcriptional regulator [Alkalibaculum sporogenes]
MSNLNSLNMSIAQIRYFIKVVECNSFTKASQQLNMSQSSISKNISSLEQTLELQLFIRENKRIIITEAGIYLYKEFKEAIKKIDQAIDESHILQGGYSNNLTIGGLDAHRPDAFVLPLVKKFKKVYKNISIQVENWSVQDVRHKLIDGELDIIFTVLYDVEQLNKEIFDYKVVAECTLSVGMLETNPLCEKSEITILDLKDSHFVSISPQYTPSYNHLLKEICTSHGFQPKITYYTSSANSLISNLRNNKEVFICDEFYRDYLNKSVCWKPLKGTISGIAVAWKKDNKKKSVRLFIDSINL